MDISQTNNQNTESLKHDKSAAISWQAEEFPFHDKGLGWYFIFWTIFGILVVVSILSKNILMAVLFGIFAVILYFYSKREPRLLTYEINGFGVKINDNLYPYEKISSFWILYYPPDIKELVIKYKKSILPNIKIQLADADPNEIRKKLLNFINEELHEESLIELLARILRF